MTEKGVYVNQFIGSELSRYGLNISTQYPENGVVEISGDSYKFKELFIRIPAWCDEYALIEGYEQNQDFFSLLLDNDERKRELMQVFLEDVYKILKEE